MSDNLVQCAKCERLIEGTQTSSFLGMSVFCRRTICHECEYAENFRTNRLVPQPYRNPFPRPTLDGKMPDLLRKALADQHIAQEFQKWKAANGE